MFSKNGQYLINQYQQETFNKQLPSSSIKVSFKKERQKILNVNQKKYQIQILKQQIYQKCKQQELTYLDLLQRQKKRYQQFKDQDRKEKINYMQQFMRNKYKISEQKIQKMQKQKYMDSIDKMRRENEVISQREHVKRYEFSLQTNKQEENKKIVENEWINRVREARKKLQNRLGKYYKAQEIENSSGSKSSSENSNSKSQT